MNSDRKESQAASPFSNDELVLLNNALNEVCNGISMSDDEFQTRLGVERKAARRLLAKMGGLLGETHHK